MKLEFVTYENLLTGENCYSMDMIEKIFAKFIDALTSFTDDFSSTIELEYNIKEFKKRIFLGSDRAIQAVLEALDDLKRLKDFHPVNNPNKLKYASYLSYWWLQRKPLYVDISKLDLSDSLLQRLVYFNEFFLVTYVLNELFNRDNIICPCDEELVRKYDSEWVQVQNYLLYFFSYRANSPKSIEAFLHGAILHPLWSRNKDVGLE